LGKLFYKVIYYNKSHVKSYSLLFFLYIINVLNIEISKKKQCLPQSTAYIQTAGPTHNQTPQDHAGEPASPAPFCLRIA